MNLSGSKMFKRLLHKPKQEKKQKSMTAICITMLILTLIPSCNVLCKYWRKLQKMDNQQVLLKENRLEGVPYKISFVLFCTGVPVKRSKPPFLTDISFKVRDVLDCFVFSLHKPQNNPQLPECLSLSQTKSEWQANYCIVTITQWKLKNYSTNLWASSTMIYCHSCLDKKWWSFIKTS